MSRTILAAAALCALALPAAKSVAAHDHGPAFVWAAAVGQSPAADASSRDQMTDLLNRARQAMAEGHLETADSLISRAEGLNVTIGVFHMGDSPKKARRDWQRLREARGAQPAVNPFPTAGAAGPTPYSATALPAVTTTAPAAVTTTSAAPTTPAAVTTTAASPYPATPYPTTSAPTEPLTPFARAPITAPPAEDRLGKLSSPTTSAGGAPAMFPPGPVSPLPGVAAPQPTAAAQPVVASGDAKLQTLEFVRQARAALAAGNLAEAERLAAQADALHVPDEQFGPQEDRPWLVIMEIEKIRRRGIATPAAVVVPVPSPFPGVQAVYDPATDTTRNVPAGAVVPAVGAAPPVPPPGADPQAVQPTSAQLQPAATQALPAHAVEPIGPGVPQRNELLEETARSQDLLARQITSDVTKLEAQAEQAQATDPNQSQALLQQARVLVEKSAIHAQSKQILLRRIDRNLAELDKYVETNRPRIELAQQNREVKDQLDREQQAKLDMQRKLASLVEEYNTLIDQQRFAEAEVLAKRASEFAPYEPIVAQLQVQSKALRRMFNNAEISNLMEEGTNAVLTGIDLAAVPYDDNLFMQFPRDWAQLRDRRGALIPNGAQRSPKEIEIEQKLKMPVSLKFDKLTMTQAFEKLSAMTGVPIYVDAHGLAAEGVDSSTPISIDLSTEISLRSALNILLSEHHLTYVVKDEVLKITSERMRSEDAYTVTYPVGDLVIPIPNFTPSNRMGLSGALADAQATLMNGGANLGLASHAPISVMADSGSANGSVLGQVNVPFMSGGGGGPPVSGTPQNIGFGPGGMGGGVQPDFDSLIELITSTIRQQDWQDNGGTIGFIKSHDTTLSLVITHDVRGHEEIENLLTQLRKLQDLQVTIEVRFITLSDAFYEQVGVDFDFDIDDDIDAPYQVFGRPDESQPTASGFSPATNLAKDALNPSRDVQDRDHGQSVTVGMSAPGVFNTDLDIPFSNTSFGQAGGAIAAAIPGALVGTAGAQGGANVGFAILSDLEAYFFIKAVQDDQRSNILQAPKVTMFNGQQAFVSDTEQRPFVISVVPVVGDFAAAQQPVIVVLNEGTSLSVQAVVSNDRRFVRMTMVPFFSQIGEVNTFTFEGSESSTRTSSSATQGPGEESEDEEESVSRTGTTVQLPTFAFQTVTTTVSVPDGGTVLLGGIKRMREARFENGVPLLSKIPYVNRLFTNVAIGKSSSSLMMMVTPRIIIQEEEEAAIGIAAAPSARQIH